MTKINLAVCALGLIIVRCSVCKRKVFEYMKMGKGKLHHCWKKRIIADYSMRKGDEVYCACGNLIGYDCGGYIKLIHDSFKVTGKK